MQPTSDAATTPAAAAAGAPDPWWSRRRLLGTYFSVDPRSLGLFRIAMALVMIIDVVRRLGDVDLWLSNDGLLPAHVVAQNNSENFSFFLSLGSPAEAWAGALFCLGSFVGLLLGWRTRMFQILSLLCITSLHNRVLMLENGGTVVIGILATWSVFLPLGRRFSIDALLASWRRYPEVQAEELNAPRSADTEPYVSLAVFAVLLQIAVIYLFNVANKSGPEWYDGTALHFTLQQERIVTWIGVAVRMLLPAGVIAAMSYGTLVLEAIAGIGVLLPVRVVAARRAAMVSISLVHLGILLMVNVGLFSAAMMCWIPFLLSAADWEALRGRLGRGGRVRAYFDASCGICFTLARLLRRLDGYGRITWIPNDDHEALARAEIPAGLVGGTVVVVGGDGRPRVKSNAIATLLAALPCGWLWALPLRLPGLAELADLVYDRVAANRAALSAWLGMTACGLPRPAAAAALPEPEPPPALRAWRRLLKAAQSAAVAVLLVAGVSQLISENETLRTFLGFEQPALLRQIINYPRLRQGWAMFSPSPPRVDAMLVIDAETADGRHFDPFAAMWRGNDEVLSEIPTHLGIDQFFCDYMGRIKGGRAFHPALRHWLERYHLRTGRSQDRIVRYKVYELTERTPGPNDPGPTGQAINPILSSP